MGRIEFPSTPINAVQQQEATPSPYSQLTLEGTADYEQSAEIELGNCTILTQPTYRKRKKGNEWHSTIHVQPDLLHPDQEGEYEVHATGSLADMTHKHHLKPGDTAMLKGYASSQDIQLASGENTIIHHFTISSLEVIARSPRISTTAYEKQHGS
jgi:hypothetical protein